MLMGVAYRMTGSVGDAENAVQDAYARWYGLTAARRAEVRSPTAWLVRVVSRLCLDLLGSARARRERYVGEWLPEPLPGGSPWTSHGPDGDTDPADRVVLDDSVTMALLVVLDTMTPAERVVFVLHDVFAYPFADVAEIVDRSPAACRQLASSARRRVRTRAGRSANLAEHERVVDALRDAWQAGDVAGLLRVLDPDVVAVADGGGVVGAPPEPAEGAPAVARFLLDVHRRQPDLRLTTTTVNGRPGLVARAPSGRLLAVVATANGPDGPIRRIWAIRNPDKLTAWT